MSVNAELKRALSLLEKHATEKTLKGMARYGLPSDNAIGVSIADIQKIAKRLGKNHALALALWSSGGYEARLLASFVDDAALVTAAQMNRWCRDFDNWGVVDTVCFKLFDRAPDRWKMVGAWAGKRGEFQKRAAFALLASLAAHDKTAPDAQFLASLKLVDAAAADDRNFVKKGVSWGLRMTGRRNPKLRTAAVELSRKLAISDDPTRRWLGKEALKDLKAKL